MTLFLDASKLVTHQQIADACGRDIRTVRRWLSGEHQPPREAWIALAELLEREANVRHDMAQKLHGRK